MMLRQRSITAPSDADPARRVLRAACVAFVLTPIAACSSTPDWTDAIDWHRKANADTVAQAPAQAAASADSASPSIAAPAWLPGLAPAAGGGSARDGAGYRDDAVAESDEADQGVWAPAPSRAPRGGDARTTPSPPVTVASAPSSGGAASRGSATSRAADAVPASPVDADAFVKRGDELLGTGDITGARLCYERAVAAGIAAAATSVGKTYDPLYLATARVQGLHGDAAQAAAWYRKGITAGDPEALLRLSALSQSSLR